MHGHGHIVRAKAAAADTLAAVDRVVDKLEHRIEKLKGKLIGRSHPRRHGSVNSTVGEEHQHATTKTTTTRTTPEPGTGSSRPSSSTIKPMTPEEAALQMDLLGHDFYFFTNADTERAAVVYRRNDGNIGLIDAQLTDRRQQDSVSDDEPSDAADGSTEPIRVLIADDHALFRRGLNMVLESEEGIEVVAEAEDGEDAVAKAEEFAPDVVLMDVRMPRMSGIEATRTIRDVIPTAKILMLTVSDEEDDLYEAIKAGANGYLLKEISIEEVADAIRAVVQGQSLISPSMASKLLTEFNTLVQAGRGEAAVPGAPPHRPRARGAQARRPGHEQPRDRRRALHLREHGEEPRAQHPREAAPPLPDGGRRLRRAREAARHPLADRPRASPAGAPASPRPRRCSRHLGELAAGRGQPVVDVVGSSTGRWSTTM